MLITMLKQKDEVSAFCKGKTFTIICEGCKEVYFPETGADELLDVLQAGGIVLSVIRTDYICSPENLELQLKKHSSAIDGADTILVFSCGVGMSAVSALLPDKNVFTACDTCHLPGFQGVTPLGYDCALCGQCHLNDTGGICPITSCSKSLVNGQCGGARNGMCEVDNDMECGWALIYDRLGKLDRLDTLLHKVKVHDYGN